ncbi:MAG: patatin-like phospholipase family protein [Candidatus Riflebacteria bacterium]
MNILSIDGGGIRGVIVCQILSELIKTYPRLIQKTDVFVGTSTGGIIALGLAKGSSIEETKTHYLTHGEEIFDKSLWNSKKTDFDGFVSADYSSNELKIVLNNFFGSIKLGEIPKKVVIPAFNVQCKSPTSTWRPKVFHNFAPLALDAIPDPDLGELARDVALYTSAAPTYFPIANGYVDGGVFANNPSMVGLAQVLDSRFSKVSLSEVKLLSISSGENPSYIDDQFKNADWGLYHWRKHIIEIMMEGAANVADFQCKQLLGEKYKRLKYKLTKKIALDDSENLESMITIGKNTDFWEQASITDWLKANEW